MRRTWWLASVAVATLASGCGKSTQPAADKRPMGGDANLAAVGSSGNATAGSAGSGSASMSMTKKPGSGSAATFVKGSSLSPSKELAKWMTDQKLNGQPKLLRLPIVLTKGPRGFDISQAKIGAGSDALVVYANDASLGVGLADRARSACKGGETTCAFWVEGYWNEKSLAGGPELDVKKAEPLADPATATHAEVEGESGN